MIRFLIHLSLLFGSLPYLPPRQEIVKPVINLSSNINGLSQINFIENSWSAAVKKAAADKKLIFVDAYAVWCVPCRKLKATTFKDKTAAEFFNKNFVNLSLDMEKGEGLKLSGKWGVEEFPTLIILDHNGNVITGNIGFLDAKDLVKFGKKALVKKQEGH